MGSEIKRGPQMRKWSECHEKAASILEFLEWMEGQGYELCDSSADWTGRRAQDLVYDFFEVDPKKLDDERRAMLDAIREQSGEAG